MVVLRPHPTGLLTRLLLSLPPGRWTWTDMVQKTAGAFTVVVKMLPPPVLDAFSLLHPEPALLTQWPLLT